MPECHASGEVRPRLEVADVVRSHGDAYRRQHVLTPEQSRTLRAIELCRTAALGGHLDLCQAGCGYERPAYNSCRDRHCPKCQALAQAVWVEARQRRLLDTHYFHVVFTLPEELRPLVHNNRRLAFDLLFSAAVQTLLELSRDPRRLDAVPGMSAVLHTWSRNLSFHPHLHVIVTGGGLSSDGRWHAVRGGRFLFPVKVLSRLFRGKFMAGLVQARRAGKLSFGGGASGLEDDGAFEALCDRLYHREWVVYAKRPFGGAAQVFRYLGRYTHRVGIANSRIQAIDDGGVRFGTKDGGSVTLRHDEFLRRFLLHVLPPGFVKIRHYGLLAGRNVKQKLPQARRALGQVVSEPEPVEASRDWRDILRSLTGLDLRCCPRCRVGVLQRVPLPSRSDRAPPQVEA